MQVANIEVLLAPVSADNPCGADLEYGDPAFAALDRATRGKPEQQIGSTVIPAEEPDWKAVGRQAVELLGRTKDLRNVPQLRLPTVEAADPAVVVRELATELGKSLPQLGAG